MFGSVCMRMCEVIAIDTWGGRDIECAACPRHIIIVMVSVCLSSLVLHACVSCIRDTSALVVGSLASYLSFWVFYFFC